MSKLALLNRPEDMIEIKNKRPKYGKIIFNIYIKCFSDQALSHEKFLLKFLKVNSFVLWPTF